MKITTKWNNVTIDFQDNRLYSKYDILTSNEYSNKDYDCAEMWFIKIEMHKKSNIEVLVKNWNIITTNYSTFWEKIKTIWDFTKWIFKK